MHSDVIIVGGGPGGAASALALAQKGIQSIIVEKETFPRYHIGESLTTECGNALRALGLGDEMMKRAHPRKRGVKVYGPQGKNSFYVPVMGRSPEGELFDTFTWQVRRSDFDKMLLDAALAQGAQLIPGQAIKPLLTDDGAVCGVRVRTQDGSMLDITSKVVIDASGQATFLGNAGVTSPKIMGNYNKQIAIFSQVKNTVRDEGEKFDDTLIFYRQRHHWGWFIPLDAETVSVGVVVPSSYFMAQKESKPDFLVRELGELNDEMARRIPDRTLVEEVRAVTNYSYHIKEFAGPGYLCVGDSHRFIDPIFSFGVTFGVRESQMAADAVETYLNGEHRDAGNPFAEYQRKAEGGQDVIQEMVDAFWNHPFAFAFFVHNRYTEDFIDLFAARIYLDEPTRGLQAIRTINAQSQQGYEASETEIRQQEVAVL